MEDSIYRGFNTNIYMTTGMARVTRQEFIGDIKTVAVANTQSKALIVKELYGDVEFLNYPTREAAMQAVLDKKADAAYVYA